MRRIISLVATTFILGTGIGCGTTYVPPKTVPPQVKNHVLPSNIETVWQGLIHYFADHNIPIETLDHNSYFIKASSPLTQFAPSKGVQFNGDTVAIENEACDCGVAKIPNVWGTTSKVTVGYNITLNKKEDTQTEMILNVYFNGAYYGKRNTYASGYDIELPLECVSKGTMENQILDFLRSLK